MVIADRRTQTIATSQRAPDAARPPLLGLLNAPIRWGGATWSAYMWDDVIYHRGLLGIGEIPFFHGCLERGSAAASVGNGVSGRLLVFWNAAIRHARSRFCST